MKKDLFKRYSLALFGSVLVATFTATGAFSFAWFTNNNNITRDFSGETKGAYFASGDGSSEKPFIINKPIHLYNLSWLQYLGFFNEDKKDADGNTGKDNAIDKQYYFKISADLDMNGWILPPIGTKTNPFVGNFDGGNYTISNLTISNKIGTDAGNITKHPGVVTETHFNSEDNPNIIGFFGVIGSVGTYSLTFSSDINAVSNFYLDGVKIYTYNSNVLCGMLAGYVNGTLTNAGVHYGNMNIAKGTQNISDFANVSSYSLIGDYNKEKYSWDDDPDGGDVGYGTSTDIRQLYYDLGGSDGTSSIEVSGKQALPFRADSNDESIKEPSQKTATVNLSENTTGDVNLASNQQAAKNNIGYYVGNSVKAFRDSSVTSLTITSPSYYYSYFSTDVPDEVTSFLNKETTDKSGNASYNYQYSIFISDSTQTALSEGYNNADNLNLVENAIVNDFTSCSSYKDSQGKLLLVPNRCIWVAPKQAGKFKMVVYNTESSYLCQLAIYRLIRSTPKDYSTYFTSATKFLITNGEETSGSNANITIPKSNSKTALQAYYYAFDVTDDDVSSGYEFAITQNVGKPYIAYLDIGNNGGSDEDDRTILTGFDFVEKDSNDSIIKITDDSYTKSKVSFKISNATGGGASTSAYSYYFRRTGETTVLYYFTPTSGGGLSFTVLGTSANAKEGSSSDLDDTTTSA